VEQASSCLRVGLHCPAPAAAPEFDPPNRARLGLRIVLFASFFGEVSSIRVLIVSVIQIEIFNIAVSFDLLVLING